MADADSSLTELYFEEESTWGTIPGGELTEIRTTGEDLSQETQTVSSDELRGDRQVADQVRTFKHAAGPINFELSWGSFDTFFEHALMDSFSTAINLSASDIGVDASNTEFTSPTGSGTDFTSNNISVGQWVKTSGFNTAANNDYWYVTSVAEDALGVRDNAGNLVDETSGASVSIDGSTLRNGTTKKSMFIERLHTDLTEYDYYTGMRVNTFNLNIQRESKITGSFGMMGKEEVTNNQSSQGSSTSAANTNQIFNTSDHIPRFIEGGSVLGGLRQFNLQMQNQVRNRSEVSSVVSRETGVGTIQLTGSLQAYFTSPTLYEKYVDFTASSFSVLTEDPSGNAYIFTIFNADFTDGSKNAGAVDNDIVSDLNWSAQIEDGNIAKTIQVDKISA